MWSPAGSSPVKAACDQARSPSRISHVESERALLDAVLAHRRNALTRARVIEADRVDVVATQLHAGGERAGDTADRIPASERTVETVHAAVVELLELVAVLPIVEDIGEVREKIELVVDRVGERVPADRLALVVPVEGQAAACRVAAVGGIDEAEPVERAGLDRAQRGLVCRGPVAVVGARRERPAV